MMNPSRFLAVVSTAIIGILLIPSCNRSADTGNDVLIEHHVAQLFAYDPDRDPVVVVDSEKTLPGVVIRDGHYASIVAKHGDVKIYCVRPAADGSYAGILYFHWLGRPRGNREEFLDEAIMLAHRGVVSVLIQGYFPWNEDPHDGATDRQQVVEQTIDARRALDILLREPGVDPKRIAYVGHDYGAMFGAIISGIETRIKAYVLVAGMGNFGDWSLKYWPATAAAGERTYREALAPVDPIHFVPYCAPASVMFQFATNDKYIAEETARAFSDAASQPKFVHWYSTTHEMVIPEVSTDRVNWLAQQLGFVQH
jgi:dienelactone hydrolase